MVEGRQEFWLKAALTITFFAYAAIFSTSLWALVHLCFLALAFIIGLCFKNHEPFWLWALLALTLWLVIGPFVLSQNPNYVGCLVVLGLAAAIAYKHWWFCPIGGIALLLLQARGAILAFGIVLCFSVRHRLIAITCLLSAIFVVILFSDHRLWSVTERLGIWQDVLRSIQPYGFGFGGFVDWYTALPVRTSIWAPTAAYNDGLQLILELGIGALPLFALIALALDSRRPRHVLVAFLALGLTFYPLYIPIIAYLGFMALGNTLGGSNGTVASS